MRLPIPVTDSWTAHLKNRFQEAKEISLIEKTMRMSSSTPQLFLPDNFNYENLPQTSPELSLRDFLRIPAREVKWVARLDCFEEASQYIKSKFNDDSFFLACEAGYSKNGDKSLERKEHIFVSGKPILIKEINKSKIGEITRTLRWSRSSRVLGIITNSFDTLKYRPADSGFFVCDALDGDTLITTEFKTPSAPAPATGPAGSPGRS